jgi:hypothetical protein
MILRVHAQGASSYHVGDEVWDEALPDVLRLEAATVAVRPGGRDAFHEAIAHEMTAALARPGDNYRAPTACPLFPSR